MTDIFFYMQTDSMKLRLLMLLACLKVDVDGEGTGQFVPTCSALIQLWKLASCNLIWIRLWMRSWLES
jgi:Mg2+/citrate symporter